MEVNVHLEVTLFFHDKKEMKVGIIFTSFLYAEVAIFTCLIDIGSFVFKIYGIANVSLLLCIAFGTPKKYAILFLSQQKFWYSVYIKEVLIVVMGFHVFVSHNSSVCGECQTQVSIGFCHAMRAPGLWRFQPQ